MNNTLVRVMILVGALSGCGGRGQLIDAPPFGSDAGPSDSGPDAGGMMPAPTNSDVTGRRHEICHQVPADVDTPIDVSLVVVQALVPDDRPAGFRVMNGTGDTDGRFTIADVPDGVTYFLRLDNTYYATDQHMVDIRSERTFRCLPVPDITDELPYPTNLRYTLTNMTPVVQGEGLDFASLTFGYYSFSPGERLQVGDTATAGAFNWRAFYSDAPLINAAAGDDLHVFHRRTQFVHDPASQRVRLTTRIIDWFDATGVTMQEGAEASIMGAFQRAPERLLTFSIDPGHFDTDAGVLTIPGGLSVQLFANPLALSSNGAVLLDLNLSDSSHLASSVQTVTDLVYGDPFPVTWKRSLNIDYLSQRRVFDPFYGLQSTILSHNEQLIEFTGEIETTSALHPPSGVTINGTDFTRGGKVTFDGQAPAVMHWKPAAGATAYRLTVYDLEFGTDISIATFWTTDTTLRLPASVFLVGPFHEYYAFVLDAVESATDLRTGHALAESTPFFPNSLRLPAPIRIAGRASGRLHFVAHCGDGEVQPSQGEACDTRGESDTCNDDCTLAMCGDGVFNPTAGEECDTAGDSIGCNSDCTVSVCGDGHINYATEDCDNGNALDDGNGCSADCKFNNHCGDGIIQDVVEFCDPGAAVETATCDFDCTPAFCGDGYVNTAAGEQCDDPSDTHCVNCRLQ